MQIRITKGNDLSDDIYIVSVPGTSILVCTSFNKNEAVGEMILSHEFRTFGRIAGSFEILDVTGEV